MPTTFPLLWKPLLMRAIARRLQITHLRSHARRLPHLQPTPSPQAPPAIPLHPPVPLGARRALALPMPRTVRNSVPSLAGFLQAPPGRHWRTPPSGSAFHWSALSSGPTNQPRHARMFTSTRKALALTSFSPLPPLRRRLHSCCHFCWLAHQGHWHPPPQEQGPLH